MAIVGAGPAGLLLGQLLSRAGIDNIILEAKSADYVLGRIRAGVLEQGTVSLLERAGVGARMRLEGLPQDGFSLAFSGRDYRVDLKRLTGKSVMVYGQTEVTRDLMQARSADANPIFYEAQNVHLSDLTGTPQVSFTHQGSAKIITCDFIAGCDGFHGISRASIPEDALQTFTRAYPFAWLGLMADVPPAADEMVYANHYRGFAQSAMRSKSRSRYYVQVDATEKIENWSDSRFFDEFRRRLPQHIAEKVVAGPALEKSLTVLRSFVAEPMRYGNLFLAGDAAHQLPPTGAKGLNLAMSDVHYLSSALIEFYNDKSAAGIDDYSVKALRRVWKSVRFSWWMTELLHQFPGDGGFKQRIQHSELDHIASSGFAAAALAENYVGVPY